jgi:hypothetical protein
MIGLHDVRLDVAAALGRAVRRVCCAVGCDNRTSHAKPYCLAHLHLMPYVGQLQGVDPPRGRAARGRAAFGGGPDELARSA